MRWRQASAAWQAVRSQRAIRRPRHGAVARSHLDVFLYVKNVLDRLLTGETDYDVLRPDVWKQSHPEAIRIYRQEERRSRADAKAVKRARRRIARKG